MSGKYKSQSSHSSRRSKDDKDKKRIKNVKSYHSEPKTPPLPSGFDSSIAELLKQRDRLKEKLKHMSNNEDKTVKKAKSYHKKRKHDNDHDTYKKKLNKVESQAVKNKNFVTHVVESSPELQDQTQLDSEEEEHIIEQRRKQRKQLLEKFSAKAVKVDSKNVSDSNVSEISVDSNQQDDKQIISNAKSEKKVSDMFAEEDFLPNNNSDQISKDQSVDDWDDAEGYYKIKIGDVLNNKYTIKDLFGQGVFANVVKATDNSHANNNVAIKITRNNDLMYRTGLKEITVLKEISNADPDNKCHCVRMKSYFMHKGHLCLVLECLHMDLRSVLKKYGRNHGIHMKALMSYSRQLLIALKHLKKIGIVHADIKPDNILVNEKKNVLKLCDFGSATYIDDNEPTPYLVSRFYRAPEIILGMSYSYGIDLWSTACSIYEMATGRILFTGSSNNKMLKCFMDLKGKIPNRLLRKGKFKDQHFNYNYNFLLHKKDEFTGREKVVEITNVTVVRDLHKELLKSYKDISPNEESKISQLKDFLDKILMIDPAQRLSLNDCLRHDFIQAQLQR